MNTQKLDKCASGTGCQRDGYDMLGGMCEDHFCAEIEARRTDIAEALRRWHDLTEMYKAALKARERGEDWR